MPQDSRVVCSLTSVKLPFSFCVPEYTVLIDVGTSCYVARALPPLAILLVRVTVCTACAGRS